MLTFAKFISTLRKWVVSKCRHAKTIADTRYWDINESALLYTQTHSLGSAVVNFVGGVYVPAGSVRSEMPRVVGMLLMKLHDPVYICQ